MTMHWSLAALNGGGRRVGRRRQHVQQLVAAPGQLQMEATNRSYFPVIITHSGWITTTAAAALEACGVDPARAPAALRALARGTLRYNIKFRQGRQRLYTQQAQDGEANQPP